MGSSSLSAVRRRGALLNSARLQVAESFPQQGTIGGIT